MSPDTYANFKPYFMIHYYSEDIKFSLSQRRVLSSWIKSVASSYGFSIGSLNYIFCSDSYLLDINKRFLGHDFFTDIITFDTSDYEPMISASDSISGEIYISVDTVRSNSVTYKSSFADELHRVMIHGVLHLTGQNDLSPEDFEIMKSKENIALQMLNEK